MGLPPSFGDGCFVLVDRDEFIRVQSGAGEVGEMLRRPFGITLLAGVFLAAGLAGIAVFWLAWPRNSNTSPLAALFALMWSCTYVLTALLTWRRSRLAAPAFLAAIGLLVFPASFLFPGGQLFPPSFVVIVLVALLGYRYLRGAREITVNQRL